MPGHTRQQTHDATQLVEENLDDFFQDCALMSAIVTGKNDEPKTFQEAVLQGPRKAKDMENCHMEGIP